MMKRFSLVLSVAIFAASAAWTANTAAGTVDYQDGSVTATRSGQLIEDISIGDPLYSNDMINTGAEGHVVIALAKSTGMTGKITVMPRTSFYFTTSQVKGEAKNSVQLLAGQVGVKVAKLTQNSKPVMEVRSENTVMGVRGTDFKVINSVNGGLLVTCVEGDVECQDESGSISAKPGQAVQKDVGGRLKLVPVAVSNLAKLEEDWITEEIEAFKANAPRAAKDYAARYTSELARFNAAYNKLQASPVLKKWLEEDRAGLKVPTNDPKVNNEKTEVRPILMEIKGVAFIFEKVYYRILEIEPLVMGTSAAKTEIRAGYTLADFFAKLDSESKELARRMAMARFAEELFDKRNIGGTGFPGLNSDDDFFGGDLF